MGRVIGERAVTHFLDETLAVIRIERAARAALGRARRLGRPVLASASVPVAIDGLELFARGATLARERVYWERPDDRRALVGLGAAWSFTSADGVPFRGVAEDWRALLDGAVVHTDPTTGGGVGPVLLGGFAFDPSAPSHRRDLPEPSPWHDLPAARMLLPRFALARASDGSWLTINLLVDPETEVEPKVRRTREELAALTRSTASLDVPKTVDTAPGARLTMQSLLSPADWQAIVAEATAAIRAGQLEKVVLAREVRVHADRPFAPEVALARLRRAYPSCTVFAIADEASCFLGATPERLVRLERGQVRVSCLAGTTARGGTPEEDDRLGRQLLDSAKNRLEHAVVARMLRDRLADVCRDLRVPDAPTLMRVRNVQHLYTPITGLLREGSGLMDLAARLHPTPAVGGFPNDEALRFIRARERMDRGWYAGPFGWIDARGDGDFAVAIRSALLRDNVSGPGDRPAFSEAHLYAGCGIVGDSTPESEYLESCLKLRPMLAALGEAER